MLRNYIKIALRNLVKNKVFSFINIGGLAVGMAVAMLIGLWIWDELSFNKSFANYDRLVQVMQNQTFNGKINTQTAQPMPLGYELRASYKSDFKYIVLSSWTQGHIISNGEKRFTIEGNHMQPEAPEMLSLKMLKGSRNGLQDPSSILISASVAEMLFGDENPIEKLIKLDNRYSLKVTGVYEDLPYNTSFNEVKFIAPWDLYVTTEPWLKNAMTTWGNNSFQIFGQLAPNADIDKVSAKIKFSKYNKIKLTDDVVGTSFKPTIFLHPISKWHLYSEFKNGVNVGGAIEFVWMFGLIGVFVLMLACINFMNLSTARSEKRAKEVGVRKSMGSLRRQLIVQFFSESLVIVCFALLLALVFLQLSLPLFNEIADKKIKIPYGEPLFWLICISFTLLTGLIAGSYPALYLSSFQPVKVLKGKLRIGKFASLPRKVLVVIQFTVSVVLIIGTAVVFRQIQHAKERPIGYTRDGLIYCIMKTPEIINHYDAVKNELIGSGAAIEMTASQSPVTDVWSNSSGFTWKGKDPNSQDDFAIVGVFYDYGKTINWQFTKGRDFSKEFKTDSSAFILNEAAIEFMGLKDPVGEIVGSVGGSEKYQVIGVVKNMIMSSPYNPVKPTIYYLNSGRGDVVTIKLNPAASAKESLVKIESIFKKYDPASPFEYKFADVEYNKKFGNEERIGKLSSIFACLAILISCLGLFGLASFTAEQRTKEIGVRKVLGASVVNLWGLLSKDFIKLVTISCLIAIPIAYYFMHGWLQRYEYRSTITWWIFVATVIGAMLVTLLTVSYQAVKAALANPVKSLRTE